MVATEITSPGRKAPPVVRAGTVEVDLAAVAALREYVLAADEFAAAKQKMEAARAALDGAAGGHAEVTFAGETVWRFKPQQRRSVDIDRLAQRHPAVYADVVTETDGYRLDVDAEYRRRLRLRTWRAAIRSKKG
jgi:hypothetical protein